MAPSPGRVLAAGDACARRNPTWRAPESGAGGVKASGSRPWARLGAPRPPPTGDPQHGPSGSPVAPGPCCGCCGIPLVFGRAATFAGCSKQLPGRRFCPHPGQAGWAVGGMWKQALGAAGVRESRRTWGLQWLGEHPPPNRAECWGVLSPFEEGVFSWPQSPVQGKGRAGLTPVLGTPVSPWSCPWTLVALGCHTLWGPRFQEERGQWGWRDT